MKQYEFISLEKQDKTLIITLNRPKALNALCLGLMTELNEIIEDFSKDETVYGAILTGSGEKAFAAGADISELASLDDTSSAEEVSRKGQDIFFAIENSGKPILAAVNGFALGGGCELAMACHLRIAAENAKFGQPEVNLGLLAGYGGTQRLVQLVGKSKATELLLTADMIDAPTALQLGLVNYVLPQSEIMNKCHEILAKIYAKSPLAIALTLHAISAGVNTVHGYDTEARNFGVAINSADGKEGTTAFLEKRKANFTGK
ncbi:MAG: enoyl-CoA hydratase/isomerase family protein [Bacteroidia bacterium]